MTPMNLDLYRRILAGETLTYSLSPRSLWHLTGPDRVRYLNGQITNDVAALGEDRSLYAAVCTAKGRMEGDVHVASHGSEFFLDADIILRESLGERLEKYLISDDATFEDVSDFWSLSHVFGPECPNLPETCFAIPNLRFGIPGYDLWIASSGSLIIGESVPSDVVETIRLEHGIPIWGAELTTQTLPPEAGPHMLAGISYNKGCYVGQETIARLKSVGHVNRTLAFLVAEGAEAPATGTKLVQGEKEIGTVTSSGFSPGLEKGIALAYVPRLLAETGTAFQAGELTLTVGIPLA